MIFLLDTETTGLKPPIEVIELAYMGLKNEVSLYREIIEDKNLPNANWVMANPLPTPLREEIETTKTIVSYPAYVSRYKPTGEIHPQASEIHGIYLRDLLKCRPSSEVKIPGEATILLGYNITFDHRVLGKPNTKLICLMQIAKKLWKQDKLDKKLENFKQTTLIDYLYPETGGALTINAHGAEADVKLSYLLLLKVIEKLPRLKTLDELVELTTQPKS